MLKKLTYTFGRQVVGLMLGLVSSLMFAKYLGAASNGAYVTMIVVAAGVLACGSLGATNYVSYAAVQNIYSNEELAGNLFFSALALTAIQVPVIFLLCMFQKWETWFYLPLLVGVFFSGVVFQSGTGYLQAIGDIAGYNAITLIAPIVLFLTGIALYFFSFISVAIFGYVLSEVAAAVAAGVRCGRHVNYGRGFVFEKSVFTAFLKKAVAYGWKAQLALLLTFFIYRGMLLILGYYESQAAVGVFSVSLSLIEKCWLASQAISIVLYNEMADRSRMPVKRLNSLAYKTLLLTLMVGVGIVLFSQWVLVDLMGREYGAAVSAMAILLPGMAAFGGARIYTNYLLANGETNLLIRGSLIVLLVAFLIGVMGAREFGISGVALSMSIVYVLYFFVVHSYVGRLK